MLFTFSMFLLLMTIMGEAMLKFFARFMNCPIGDNISTCLGISLVVRLFYKNIDIIIHPSYVHPSLLANQK